MADFLFEIGLEEVPARMIAGAQAELQERVVKMLERERLVRSGAEAKSFATPRRLAVWVKDVAARQEDVAEELLGPSVKVAYKDGVATAAAVAFAVFDPTSELISGAEKPRVAAGCTMDGSVHPIAMLHDAYAAARGRKVCFVFVVPADAGTHKHRSPLPDAMSIRRAHYHLMWLWVPAFAGTTPF